MNKFLRGTAAALTLAGGVFIGATFAPARSVDAMCADTSQPCDDWLAPPPPDLFVECPPEENVPAGTLCPNGWGAPAVPVGFEDQYGDDGFYRDPISAPTTTTVAPVELLPPATTTPEPTETSGCGISFTG